MKLYVFVLLVLFSKSFGSPVGRDVDGKFKVKIPLRGDNLPFSTFDKDLNEDDIITLDDNGNPFFEELFLEDPFQDTKAEHAPVTEATPVIDEKLEEMTTTSKVRHEEEHMPEEEAHEKVDPEKREHEMLISTKPKKEKQKEVHEEEENEKDGHKKEELLSNMKIPEPWLLPKEGEEAEKRWDIKEEGIDYQHTDESHQQHQDWNDVGDDTDDEVEEEGTPEGPTIDSYPTETPKTASVTTEPAVEEHNDVFGADMEETKEREYVVPEKDYADNHEVHEDEEKDLQHVEVHQLTRRAVRELEKIAIKPVAPFPTTEGKDGDFGVIGKEKVEKHYEGDGHDHELHYEGDGHDHEKHHEGDGHDHEKHHKGDGHDHEKHHEGDGHDHEKHHEGEGHDHEKHHKGDGHDHEKHHEGDGHDHKEHLE